MIRLTIILWVMNIGENIWVVLVLVLKIRLLAPKLDFFGFCLFHTFLALLFKISYFLLMKKLFNGLISSVYFEVQNRQLLLFRAVIFYSIIQKSQIVILRLAPLPSDPLICSLFVPDSEISKPYFWLQRLFFVSRWNGCCGIDCLVEHCHALVGWLRRQVRFEVILVFE